MWGANNGGLNTITAPPSGDAYFIAQDGDFQNSPINQDITGLHIGKTYTVGFDYAYAQQHGFDGATLQYWAVSLGDSPAQYTPTGTNPSHGFTGWYQDSFSFVADSTAETLSFLAYGNLPVPPFALLAGGDLHARHGRAGAGHLGPDGRRLRRAWVRGVSPPPKVSVFV